MTKRRKPGPGSHTERAKASKYSSQSIQSRNLHLFCSNVRHVRFLHHGGCSVSTHYRRLQLFQRKIQPSQGRRMSPMCAQLWRGYLGRKDAYREAMNDAGFEL